MAVEGYLRFPTIAGDTIVFTAEDDLWRVHVSGGRAERLTAGVAEAATRTSRPMGSSRLHRMRLRGLPRSTSCRPRVATHGV